MTCFTTPGSSEVKSKNGLSFHLSPERKKDNMNVRIRYIAAAILIPFHRSRKTAVFSCAQVYSSLSSSRKFLKTVQVHIVHRHGDRTPITPLKDQEYWQGTLPSSEVLEKIGKGTVIVRDEMAAATKAHAASGIGPYGKLTLLGILQMIQVGSRLREELFHPTSAEAESHDDHAIDDNGNVFLYKSRLFHDRVNPFHIHKVRVTSTDFPRTIQSVQALLVGLLASENMQPLVQENSTQNNEQAPAPHILIDARHTRHLIPDPQPRTSIKQIELEKLLTQRPHLIEKEKQMSHSAVRLTNDLRSLLDESNAFRVSFGIGEEKGEFNNDSVLAWTQIAELITCLKARDILPSSISHHDHEKAVQYVAWKWFENLRHPELAKLAMGTLVNTILQSMERAKNSENEPSLHIYSCHDSSLIGLLCAFKLEQPAHWPEYGSFFKVELIECQQGMDWNDCSDPKSYLVRFSLNGEVLESSWVTDNVDGKQSTSSKMIQLDELISAIRHYYEDKKESLEIIER